MIRHLRVCALTDGRLGRADCLDRRDLPRTVLTYSQNANPGTPCPSHQRSRAGPKPSRVRCAAPGAPLTASGHRDEIHLGMRERGAAVKPSFGSRWLLDSASGTPRDELAIPITLGQNEGLTLPRPHGPTSPSRTKTYEERHQRRTGKT